MIHYSHYMYIYIYIISNCELLLSRNTHVIWIMSMGNRWFFSGLGRHCDQLGAESQVIFTSMISLGNIEKAMENHHF